MNPAQPIKIQYEVYPDGDLFIARCLNIEVSSDGQTEEEALDNLREAIELYFERRAEGIVSDEIKTAAEAEDEQDEATS